MKSLSRLRLEGGGLAPVIIGNMGRRRLRWLPTLTTKVLIAAPGLAGAMVWWTILCRRAMACAVFLLRDSAAAATRSIRKCRRSYCASVCARWAYLPAFCECPSGARGAVALPLLFCLFLAVIAESTAFAAFYSGWSIALGSMARVGLFGIGVYVFLYTYSGPRERDSDPLRFAAFLFFAGAAGALFACVDFYFQLPATCRIRRTVHLGGSGRAPARAGAFLRSQYAGKFLRLFPGDDSGVLLQAQELNGHAHGWLSGLAAGCSERP